MTEQSLRPALLADIGGTNARFALCTRGGAVHDRMTLTCAEHSDLVAAAREYLRQTAPSQAPALGAIAVAAPLSGGNQVTMTNHRWSFSISEVQRRLDLTSLTVVNDFAAIALGVQRLAPGDRIQVGGGTAVESAPVAVLGPGTGLGVSALVFSGADAAPVVGEGGHVTMAPFDDRESEVLRVLRRSFDHVSAERVVSGPGLVNLYRALNQVLDKTPEADITPPEITRRAINHACPVCAETVDMFCAMLGTVAANLALSVDARGGVYVAGGIVPKLGELFVRSGFRDRFQDKGRFSDYLSGIPTYVITHPTPAFLGLSGLAAAP